jgi:dsDNA-binding SOS-regulon protein
MNYRKVKYRIVFDSQDDFSFAEKKEAYDRMARYGKLEAGEGKDDWWWTPCLSQDPRKRIAREGFIVLEVHGNEQ